MSVYCIPKTLFVTFFEDGSREGPFDKLGVAQLAGDKRHEPYKVAIYRAHDCAYEVQSDRFGALSVVHPR